MMPFDFLRKKNLNLLLNGFSVSALFYNFLLETLPKLNINIDKIQNNLSFKLEPINEGERISLIKVYKLWMAIENHTHRSDIGLLIADHFTLDRAGIVGELFLNTPNLKEAVKVIQRFLSLIINNIYLKYEESDEIAIFSFDVVPRTIIPFSALECYAKVCYNWTRHYSGLSQLPIYEIHFYANPPAHLDFYKKEFPNTELYFHQQENFIVLKRDLFTHKHITQKSLKYHTLLQEHANTIKEKTHNKNSYSQEVSAQILLKMPTGESSINNIANDLNISKSTLKRRLQQEETSFKQLTESLKKEFAFCLMQDPNLSFEEIAYLLGYTEYSPFFRAFKKWYQSTPSEFRASLRENLPL